MRKLGVNIMMMAIAFCDFGCAFIAGMYLVSGNNSHKNMEDSYFLSVFLLLYDYLTIGFHSSSILIGVDASLYLNIHIHCHAVE
ncbi:hypothetical protein CAEBREN_30104 [Caenorhabditis brenneri]|uniref:Uncharacterized protein n=1 Tax=Caenorhabditis brenneri TaxID=135651 RepID=G0MXM2_CAEBE|nr:hypothetical protein CAEBREN_30104 [Caenorhabditis brenneri]